MYSGINSNLLEDGVPQGPSYNSSPWSSIYFLVYMVAMTFVLVNLFQGFVIVTFQEVGVKAFRETKLDRNQVCTILVHWIFCCAQELNLELFSLVRCSCNHIVWECTELYSIASGRIMIFIMISIAM